MDKDTLAGVFIKAGPVAVIPQELGRVFLNLIQNACYAVLERKRRGFGFGVRELAAEDRLIRRAGEFPGAGGCGARRDRIVQPDHFHRLRRRGSCPRGDIRIPGSLRTGACDRR